MEVAGTPDTYRGIRDGTVRAAAPRDLPAPPLACHRCGGCRARSADLDRLRGAWGRRRRGHRRGRRQRVTDDDHDGVALDVRLRIGIGLEFGVEWFVVRHGFGVGHGGRTGYARGRGAVPRQLPCRQGQCEQTHLPCR
ncbi:hypothetical protein RHCRD62_100151 [Rhodococcus sp. RD6.2]|nr:hypothetical protein RHCRD62_100151 [Rhodococcus sp. RD6.2]